MFLSRVAFFGLIVFLFSCSGNKIPPQIKPSVGVWRVAMNLNGKTLPFNFELSKESDQYKMVIINAEERIDVKEILLKNDSLFISLPVFESEFKLSLVSNNEMTGVWINYYKGSDYKIPVELMFDQEQRFITNGAPFNQSIGGEYEVVFGKDSSTSSKAIGMFKQTGNKLTGTFATETGDYRYLEGCVIGDSLFLSTFDGSHAFLFKAEKKDSMITGVFYSGTHYSESWSAFKNEKTSLRNPDSLTYIKEGYEGLSFSFPNTKGKLVSLNDEQYKNKAVIVQIMGTWCPNCLDETYYFSELYKKYKADGLEIIALAFERTKGKDKAINNIERLIKRSSVDYEVLLAGATRDDKAVKLLPMLNHVMSYPTAIYIDKNGEIRRIHTGFYGPSTGRYYDEFVSETEELVKAMLAENS